MHKRTSRCIYTRIPTCPPPFFRVSPPIFLILLFVSLSLAILFQTPFPLTPGQSSRFSSSQFLLPRSHPLTKSVEQNSVEKEREGSRKRGLNCFPRPRSALSTQQHHHHYHHHYHRSQSLLRSRASTIGELAIYAWSIPPCLTRLLLRAPSPLTPYLRLAHILSLSFLISPSERDLDLSLTRSSYPRVLRLSISLPCSILLFPLPVARSERVRVPPRACRGRAKPCM